MIELFYWPTPNGHKITMFLEDTGTPYRITPVNIGAGEQFKPAFLAISPNNRMPAITDHAPADSGPPLSVFESGAILTYLGDKTGKLLPRSTRERTVVLEWLTWQVAGLGPMAGQNHHFNRYATEKLPYAIDRYVRETNRLYGVLDRQLEGRTFVAGELYSIADVAIYPWIVPWEAQSQNLSEFPNVKRWFEAIAARPSTVRAYAKGDGLRSVSATMTEESRKILFGQNAANTRALAERRAS